MYKYNLQLFGGRGSKLASGMTSNENSNETSLDRALGIQNTNRTSLDRYQEERRVDSLIRSAKFVSEGNGNWQFDIDNVGGGQVLDETGSSRSIRLGYMPNQSTYSANAWVYDENGTPRAENLGLFTTRREAQRAIKDHLFANRRVR